jgi:hypothetical protein
MKEKISRVKTDRLQEERSLEKEKKGMERWTTKERSSDKGTTGSFNDKNRSRERLDYKKELVVRKN